MSVGIKKRVGMELSTIISIASLILSAGSIVWIGGFRFSALIHKVDALSIRIDKMEERFEKRFDRLESRMDSFQEEMHKFDVRLTIVEQNKSKL